MARTRKSAGKRAARGKRRPRRRPAALHPRAVEATLADIAHEIRTPLTGIVALAELLAAADLDERGRGWATALKSTAEHLVLVTSLIVDAARADARGLVLRRELFRPRHLAEALAASLGARAQAKGLAAESDIARELPDAVIGDPQRLRTALENLIDNAVKFTDRGSVRLAVTCRKAGRGKVELVFTVHDSGIGLAAAEIRRLFRPFAQANARIARRYGGAGLGLAFAKRIGKAMGGDLVVASEPGGGSRFQLTATVDKVADKSSTTNAAGAAARAARTRPLNVLCVDANPYGRVVLNTALSELGHRADFVGTGAAAIDAVAQGHYDVVLIDLRLPDIDAVAATRRIRALAGAAARVPIVGVSDRANAVDATAADAAGMDGYLTKPLSPSALAQVFASLPARPSACDQGRR